MNKPHWIISRQGNGVYAVEEDKGGGFVRVSTGAKEQCCLIAAAPELLEVLEEIHFRWKCGESGNAMVDYMKKVKATIAKAKGEQP